MIAVSAEGIILQLLHTLMLFTLANPHQCTEPACLRKFDSWDIYIQMDNQSTIVKTNQIKLHHRIHIYFVGQLCALHHNRSHSPKSLCSIGRVRGLEKLKYKIKKKHVWDTRPGNFVRPFQKDKKKPNKGWLRSQIKTNKVHIFIFF